MRKTKWMVSILLCFFFTSFLQANNLSISNVSYDNSSYQITFDLSWDNSWRRDSDIPYNYDGVWIFLKVRECTQKELGNPGGFSHAWLSTTAGANLATNSTDGEALTVEVGTTDVDAVARGMGVFVYRTDDGGTGTISTSVTLQWDKSTQAGEMTEIELADDYDVKVFGVEMVNIPEASYALGDGGSSNCFYDYSVGTSEPYEVTSEDPFYVSDTYNRAIGNAGGTAIDADFPKGYKSFWIMKYEISQLQYAEFLNTLTRDQVVNRVARDLYTISSKYYVMFSNRTDIYYRQSICLNPSGDIREDAFGVDFNENDIINEADDGIGIACNYISLRDVLAYLDWAALRPLTELEYEKTCRGTVTPVMYENPWGNGTETQVEAITNSGKATEVASNYGTGLCNYGNNIAGPLRCGFAATNSTNRKRAGAAYYGVLDLAGNVQEPYVSFYADPAYSADFDGTSGDGELDEEGFQNVSGWPSQTDDEDVSHFVPKGGNSYTGEAYLRISNRTLWSASNYRYDSETYVTSRNAYGGGRGGR